MKNIKVAIYGWDGFICQIPRIKEGMKALGHIVTTNNPDLIYCNDPSQFPKSIFEKQKYPKAYLILNILDIPWHMPNIHEQTKWMINNLLLKADAITTISFKIKKDLSQCV